MPPDYLSECGRFEWDMEKAEANVRRHGIRFEIAVAVFDDPLVERYPDRIVDGEKRFQAIGEIRGCLLLVVVYTHRKYADNETIRIMRKEANEVGKDAL